MKQRHRAMYNLIQKISVMSLVLLAALYGNAQTDADKAKIAASQAGASALYFNPNDESVPKIEPGNFYNEKECNVRGGLPNFFSKLNSGKPVTIGYIGGSITQGIYCYRTQSAKYIQSQYPDVNMKWLNAGVSGTGTDLGACRINDQLLQYNPDLIFVEFAVNGAYQNGMEGIIRQIIKHNPNTEICLLYTILGSQTKYYVEGHVPENIQGLETIADYYNLPSIHLGMEAATLEKENKLIWKGDANVIKDKIVFSADGIHPGTAGGNIYAAAIARAINKMKTVTTTVTHALPQALFAQNWEDAKMYAPLDVAVFTKGWTKLDTKNIVDLKQFTGWFPYIMQAEKPGSSFSFKFKGSMFGLFDIGGPEVGQLSIQLDGKPVKLQETPNKNYHSYKAVPENETGNEVLNRFNSFCNNRYRGQYEFIETSNGEHSVTIIISDAKADKVKILGEKQQADITEHPDKYDRTVLYLGKILLRGEIVK